MPWRSPITSSAWPGATASNGSRAAAPRHAVRCSEAELLGRPAGETGATRVSSRPSSSAGPIRRRHSSPPAASRPGTRPEPGAHPPAVVPGAGRQADHRRVEFVLGPVAVDRGARRLGDDAGEAERLRAPYQPVDQGILERAEAVLRRAGSAEPANRDNRARHAGTDSRTGRRPVPGISRGGARVPVSDRSKGQADGLRLGCSRCAAPCAIFFKRGPANVVVPPRKS